MPMKSRQIHIRSYFLVMSIVALSCAFWYQQIRVTTYTVYTEFGSKNVPKFHTPLISGTLEIGFIGRMQIVDGKECTAVHLYDWAFIFSKDLIVFSPNSGGRVDVLSTSAFHLDQSVATEGSHINSVTNTSKDQGYDIYIKELWKNKLNNQKGTQLID